MEGSLQFWMKPHLWIAQRNGGLRKSPATCWSTDLTLSPRRRARAWECRCSKHFRQYRCVNQETNGNFNAQSGYGYCQLAERQVRIPNQRRKHIDTHTHTLPRSKQFTQALPYFPLASRQHGHLAVGCIDSTGHPSPRQSIGSPWAKRGGTRFYN